MSHTYKKCFLILIIFFTFPAFADEIHLKNGRIVKIDDYWEQAGQITYEQYGTTMYINKKDVAKIKKGSSEQLNENEEKKKELKQKYNTNGCVVFLKNGKTIIGYKSWFEDGLVYCVTDKKTYHILEKDIMQFSKSKVKKNKLKTSLAKKQKKQNKLKYYDEPPNYDFVKDGALYKYVNSRVITWGGPTSPLKGKRVKVYITENRTCQVWVETRGWKSANKYSGVRGFCPKGFYRK